MKVIELVLDMTAYGWSPEELQFQHPYLTLEPMDISQYRLAKDIGVPPRRINETVKGKQGISAETALRLSRYFGASDIQAHCLQSNALAGVLEYRVLYDLYTLI